MSFGLFFGPEDHSACWEIMTHPLFFLMFLRTMFRVCGPLAAGEVGRRHEGQGQALTLRLQATGQPTFRDMIMT